MQSSSICRFFGPYFFTSGPFSHLQPSRGVMDLLRSVMSDNFEEP